MRKGKQRAAAFLMAAAMVISGMGMDAGLSVEAAEWTVTPAEGTENTGDSQVPPMESETLGDTQTTGTSEALEPVNSETVPGSEMIGGTQQPALPYGNFRYRELEDGSVEITGYDTGTGDGITEVVIPETIAGKTVTGIGTYAFCGCSGLTGIEIPKSVTRIDLAAFYDCRGLTGIEIPGSVTSIAGNAFWGCSGLMEIKVSENNSRYASVEGILYNHGLTELQCCPSGRKGVVTIPESVTSIGNEAFEDCSGLTGIEIPGNVTRIGQAAFSKCSGLTGITIPEGVASIGWQAFEDCSGLTGIEIPGSVTSIDVSAFNGCSGLTEIKVSEANSSYSSREGILYDHELTKLQRCPSGREGVVKIPESVESIGNEAFRGCNGLTGIEILGNVTDIGSYAFEECSGLTGIEIPGSAESIGQAAFSGCSGLTGIEIPGSVESIGDRAFSGCSGLTGIEIPGSVTRIGNEAFRGCSGMAEINVSEDNGSYSSREGILYNHELTELQRCPGGKEGIVTIPESVESIIDRAFEDCSGLTGIVIPESVTSIGIYSFWGCSGMASVRIPASVVSIGRGAFYGCGSLSHVEYAGTVEQWRNIQIEDSNECLTYAYLNSLSGNSENTGDSQLAETQVPGGSEASPSSEMGDTENVGILIENGVYNFGSVYKVIKEFDPNPLEETDIGETGFRILTSKPADPNYTYNYNIVVIRDKLSENTGYWPSGNLPDTGYYLFLGAGSHGAYNMSLKLPGAAAKGKYLTITYARPKVTQSVSVDRTSDEDNFIRIGGTSINLKECEIDQWYTQCIRLDRSIYGIDFDFAKWGAAAISEIAVSDEELGTSETPESSEAPGDKQQPELSYGNFLYRELSDGSVEITGYDTGTGDGITEVVIPEKIAGKTVTGIGDRAFRYCTGLTGIEIPGSVTSIGDHAFGTCSSLTGIMIPEGVTSIGDRAFAGCRSLTGIEIPGSVTSIGVDVFYECSGMAEINVSEDNGNYASREGILYNHELTELQYCPERKEGIVTIPGSVESIGDSAFKDCSGLTGIEIPGSVESIGSNAFRGCSGLTGIEIPESVTSIGGGVFRDCRSLTEINVSEDNSNYASREGILYNHELTELQCCPEGKEGIVVIPESVTSIGNEAFRDCSGLTGIEIPGSVTNIGDYAFWGCNGLTSIEVSGSVTSIGFAAFRYCSGLAEIKVSEDNGSYASREGILYNHQLTELQCCPGGKEGIVTIPESVESIGNEVFYGCSGLTEIEIPESVTSIGYLAFYGCSSLTGIEIPGSVTSISNWTFYGCSGLTSVRIPVSVAFIGSYAFDGCQNLNRVEYAGTVEQWKNLEIADGNDCLTNAYLNSLSGNSENTGDSQLMVSSEAPSSQTGNTEHPAGNSETIPDSQTQSTETEENPMYPTLYKFDFGIDASLVDEGWIPITVNKKKGKQTVEQLGLTYSDDKGYGFVDGNAVLEGRIDAGYTQDGGYSKNVYQDYIVGTTGVEFAVKVPNGRYQVLLMGGSQNNVTNKVAGILENNTDNSVNIEFSSPAKTYVVKTFEVNVEDGRLDFVWTDNVARTNMMIVCPVGNSGTPGDTQTPDTEEGHTEHPLESSETPGDSQSTGSSENVGSTEAPPYYPGNSENTGNSQNPGSPDTQWPGASGNSQTPSSQTGSTEYPTGSSQNTGDTQRPSTEPESSQNTGNSQMAGSTEKPGDPLNSQNPGSSQTPPTEVTGGTQTPDSQTPPTEDADNTQTPPTENADNTQTPLECTHIWDGGTVKEAATCASDGVTVYTCTACGETREELLDATEEHVWGEWTTENEATVFDPETRVHVCLICEEEEEEEFGEPLKSVMKLAEKSLTMKVKQTGTFTIVSGMANGDYVESVESSSPKIVKVAKFNDDGDITLRAQNKAGSAKLTITLAGGAEKTITVKVQKGAVKTTKITGLPKKLTLKKGKRVALNPVISPITSQEKVTYTTSKKKVAAVTKKGVVTAKAKGTAKITVKSGSKKAVVTVNVK